MKFIINGGKKLQGGIEIRGSKNAATPIIAATVLTDRPVILENVPKIGDVLKMLAILESCGSRIEWLGESELRITNKNLDPEKIDQKLVKQIRSSILLVGPMLARFKKFQFAIPGGCQIGSRPVDTHLEALEKLGAVVDFDSEKGLYNLAWPGPKQNKICLKEFSVTATENLLMFGSVCPLEVRLAAAEPHVEALGKFLMEVLGLRIDGLGTHRIKIFPEKNPVSKEFRHRIIPDPIEAGTLAVLAAATRSILELRGGEIDHLDAPLAKLNEFGALWELKGNSILVNGKNSSLRAAKVQTLPYPGLPTDLQAPFGVLATQAAGRSLIFDTMYEGRLRYIQELKTMGADAEILDSHRAVINGPTVLHGAEIESLDLRAGATMVIAALVADGKSVIGNVEQIDRGYENLDGRLRELGADIQRVT